MDLDADPPEDSLWTLAVSPAIWAAHFLVSYVVAAVWCAKRGSEAGLGPPRLVIALLTAVALVAIGITGWRGWLRHGYGSGAVPHDFDTPADRHRFLGFATLLLSGLSAVATLYVALAAAFVETCR